MMKVFIDTNVFLDFIARRGEFYEPAATIVSLAYRDKIDLYVSALSFATASYVLEHHYKMELADIIEDFEEFITLCGITTINHETVKLAIDSVFEDFEDAMQHYSALLDGADCIVTRNKQDFEYSRLPVYTPTEFLESLVN